MTRNFVVSPMQNAIFGIKSSFQGLLAASLASSRLSRRLLAALLPQDARKKQKTAFRLDGTHIFKGAATPTWTPNCAPRGPSWGHPGPSWAFLGPCWGHLGPSWGLLGPSWGHLGSSWGHLGAFLGHLGAIWGRLGAFWGPFRAILGLLGAILGASWAILGGCLDIVGPFAGNKLRKLTEPGRLGGLRQVRELRKPI